MPELPEVQTTVDGLNKTVKGRIIKDVTTTYKSAYHKNKDSIKDPKFFRYFQEKVVGQKILSADRRAKNILIHLSNGFTILTHMKMTGFYFYDAPPDAKFIRLNFILDNGKSLAFSDMRKFAKVTVVESKDIHSSTHLVHLGREPLDKSFTYKIFKGALLKRPGAPVKTVLMDQTLISGIGNIYSDEILWRANVHPLSKTKLIPDKNLKLAFIATKETLKKGIDFGGDSMSDYKNIHGLPGKFQDHHRAYKQNKKRCQKRNCKGTIERMVVGTRSAHFCPRHQKLFS
ncbi:MAG: formamidopyrimidine-DNA glycosylase [Parcubacteria bacterium C7867-005]|nr:MAG: formamidopyrimidine-DNA glycosylase [Parcubacteria bacterium C7867-005]